MTVICLNINTNGGMSDEKMDTYPSGYFINLDAVD